MKHEELLSLPSVWTDRDVRYLPVPNRCDVVLTSDLAPGDLTRTAFVLPIMENGDLVMANVRKPGRGLEIPGGHIEAGEDAHAGAKREGLEEAGCHFDELVPIGFVRMTSQGTPPADWQYPHPLGFQQFFAGRVASLDAYMENEECGHPVVIPAAEVRTRLKGQALAFYERAAELILACPQPRA